MGSIFDYGKVVDLLVSVDVVNNAAKVLLARIGVKFPAEFAEGSLGDGLVAATQFLSLDADVLSANMLVVAEDSEALGQHHDGVSLDDEPDSGVAGCSIMEVGIVLVSHTRRAVVDDLHLVEDLGVLDIDFRDDREAATKTDACNVDSLKAGYLANETEVSEDVIDDGVPHTLVSLLDLAVGADIGVDNLIGIENVLPDVEEGVGVSEGKDNEGGVDAEDALDILLLLLDEVGVQGTVLRGAHIAFPVD